jgi:hypothetical protein
VAGASRCGTGAASTCASLSTDLKNCGACGQACVACESCHVGVCTARTDVLNAVLLPIEPVATSVTRGVAVGDFNGDGLQDVAATWSSSIGPPWYFADSLAIFFGDGGGGFPTVTAIHAPPDTFFKDLATGDFNRDGFVDLAIDVVYGDGGAVFGGSPMIVYGGRDAGLSLSPVLPLFIDRNQSFFDRQVRVADIDGDGYPDIVISDGDWGVGVLTNTTDGGFAPAEMTSSYEDPINIATGVLGSVTPAVIVVFNFTATQFDGMDVLWQQDGGLLVGGSAAVFDPATAVIGGDLLNVFENNDLLAYALGDAGLELIADLANPTRWSAGAAVDLNGDGVIDLVGASNGGLEVFFGRTAASRYGAVGQQATYTYGDFEPQLASGDLNGDGRVDLVEAGGSGVMLIMNACTP